MFYFERDTFTVSRGKSVWHAVLHSIHSVPTIHNAEGWWLHRSNSIYDITVTFTVKTFVEAYEFHYKCDIISGIKSKEACDVLNHLASLLAVGHSSAKPHLLAEIYSQLNVSLW